ncbi:tRNA (adenosine(37)-N6)-threonylcarbamoyltransferase complex ATPase subunit type 1 TsaE [Roseobacter sp. HKCCA0882]|uniref:tRNA (adenosine(37)-N6)-threonylcarbamoyltransferase complex ATPase subunit type 1 TsaE n=1 Tax=Roseobacter sp. HKCCA0882 TaxID=3120337 RepID=UPI0030ED20BF
MSDGSAAPLSDLPPCHAHLRLASPEAMSEFTEALAPLLEPGDVLALSGDLGAGKTHFARGVIRTRLAQIGRVEDIPSPSFTLVQIYEARPCDIWHVDLYRLGDPRDVDELGLIDAFETEICLIEWPERMMAGLPTRTIWLSFIYDQSAPDQRHIRLCASQDHPKLPQLCALAERYP